MSNLIWIFKKKSHTETRRNILIPTLFLLLLSACGPSEEEKQNIAIITCNVMSESRNMDSSQRIKEINLAREKINANPYLHGDAKIKEAFKYGICLNLVLDDPEYEMLLSKQKEAEIERIRKEKEAERAKAVNYEKRQMLSAIRWVEKNKDYLESLKFKPRFIGVYYDNLKDDLHVDYTCKRADGLILALEIIFKNGKRILDEDNFRGGCYSGKQNGKFYNYELTSSLELHLNLNRRDLKSIISEVNLYISGVTSSGSKKHGISETLSTLYLWKPEYNENRDLFENSILAENPFKYQIFPNRLSFNKDDSKCTDKYIVNDEGFLEKTRCINNESKT